jgi:hypothetical protein
MDEINEFLSRPDVSRSEKLNFLSRFFTDGTGDLDDNEAESLGRIVAAVMTGDTDALESMIFDNDGGLADDALEIDELNDIMEKFDEAFADWKDTRGIQRDNDRLGLARVNDLWKSETELRKKYEGKTLAEVQRDQQEVA